MAQDRRINASELDFEKLKANLITYMKEQPGAFQDYNFEGSAMSTMIDVLSYITHINSVNANFALNETFLDTAQLRESVVSHAKLLSYTPRSTNPSTAYVDIEVLSPAAGTVSLILDRGTKFTTIVDSVTYNLIASETSDSIVADVDGKFIFKNIKLEQGTLIDRTYTYDDTGFERYILADDYANTDSLIVEVYESATSTAAITFTKSVNITNINELSDVYFLEESREGYYEIKFGDGIIGRKPAPGNIVKLNYTAISATDINGATVFSLNDSIEGNTDAIITTVTKATGGARAESLDSVKFNAPLAFVSQNRAVTPDDYKAIIQNSYGNIDSLTVWGGEDNIPPDYGKVYISIKPLDGEALTDKDKEIIITKHLKPKNVVSITPIIVDPSYTYIDLEIFFKFNPNVANVTSSKLSADIRQTLSDYNDLNLTIFGGVFRFSNLLNAIDNSNIAVISNITRVTMHKVFTPSLNEDKYYKFDFNQGITNKPGVTNIITSTLFTYNDELATLKDYYNAEDNKYIIQIISDTNKVLNANVGTIDVTSGLVELNGFAPQSIPGVATTIKIMTKPASSDISPTRNELLSIDSVNAFIQGEVDTMATGGTSAGIDYNTVSN